MSDFSLPLKWPGGKRRMLPHILPLLPAKIDYYYEPFLGGGAMFFHLFGGGTPPRRGFLGDINQELINCYRMIYLFPAVLIDILQLYQKKDNQDDLSQVEARYYAIREGQGLGPGLQRTPEGNDALYRAARTIYLNRTCFNGLYRVNRKGQFNVPWGKRRFTFDPESILQASKAFGRALLLNCDYVDTLNLVGRVKHPLIFCDPPYLQTGVRYSENDFGPEQHAALAATLNEVWAPSATQITQIITSSDVAAARTIYKDFDCITVPSFQSISRDGATRRTKELIFYR